MKRPAAVATVWRGSGRIFAAELLILPCGLVTAGFLSRRLGAEGYGLFTLTATLVAWLGWTSHSMLARAATRSVAGTTDWRPAAAEAVRLHLLVGLGLGTAVALLASPLAHALQQPEAAAPLRLMALDLPLFALARGYRSVLVGTGDHTGPAAAGATRWLVRMAATLGLVQLGWSVLGAVTAILAASAAEVLLLRWKIGPLPQTGLSLVRAPRGDLAELIPPVALAAIAARAFDRGDLFLLAVLGADTASLGFYGAAQNLTLIVSLLAASGSPVVLSEITSLTRLGRHEAARQVATAAFAAPWRLLPFAGLAAGASSEIVRMVYGPAFAEAAMPFAILILGSVALLTTSVATALLVAAGRPWLVLGVNVPALGLLVASGLLLIPLLGSRGAALASLLASTVGAVVATALAARVVPLVVPHGSIAAGVLLAVAGWAAVRAWPASTAVDVVAKLLVISLGLGLCLLATRGLRGVAAGPAARDTAR
ncbi:MAG: oligosaccharide flippase family protein [Vicinamibacteria bacterium]|nr:oligosaccharide flippase family protein [Vicinamibacteria bacterium]